MLSGLLDDLSTQALTLADVVAMHLEAPMLAALTHGAVDDACARLQSYMSRVRYNRGVVVFETGDPSDTIFIVLAGTVASVLDLLQFSECGPPFTALWCCKRRALRLPCAAHAVLSMLCCACQCGCRATTWRWGCLMCFSCLS